MYHYPLVAADHLCHSLPSHRYRVTVTPFFPSLPSEGDACPSRAFYATWMADPIHLFYTVYTSVRI